MDFLKQAASAATGASAGKDHKKTESQSSSGGLGGLLSGALGKKEEKPQPSGGVSGFFNNALGGGAAGEKKEDTLDKAIDFVQEHVLKQGPQNNESAVEQLKDKQIANVLRTVIGK